MSSSADSAMSVVLCDSLEKIFPDKKPREFDTSIPLIAYPGERAAFQVAMWMPEGHSAGRLHDVALTVNALEGVNARLRAVDHVPVSYPAPAEGGAGYLRTEPGLYPDVLRPLGPDGRFTTTAGQWHAVWVDLDISDDAVAGSSSVLVTLSLSGGANQVRDLPLQISGSRLPALGIVNTHWFHVDGLVSYYGLEPYSERYWEVMNNFLSSAANMSVNSVLAPVWTPPLDTEEGSTRMPTQLLGISDDGSGQYSFDPTHVLRWLGVCRDAGMRYVEVPHLFTQWGARATPAIYVDTPEGKERRFGWDVQATDPSYRKLLEQLLPYLIRLLDEEWGIEQVFFHISDEPTEKHLESYSAAKAVVADLLADVTVVDALSSYEYYQRGIVSVPVAATNHARPFLDSGVDPLWLYYCVSQNQGVSNRFIAMDSAWNRVLGYQLYLADASGFLHWGFNFYNAQYSTRFIDPYLDTCSGGGFFGGDAFMVYPGRDGNALTSLRYEVFNEAMIDHRAVGLLESRTDPETVRSILTSPNFNELEVGQKLEANELRRIAVMVADALDA